MRVLVTRPAGAASGTVRALQARGHEAILSPVLTIVATGAPLPPGPFAAVLATSAQAIEALTEAQILSLGATPLHVVGERTAAAAQARGLTRLGAIAEDGAKLAASLREAGVSSRDVLYLAGRDRKPTLEQACAKLACRLQVAEIYEARPAEALTPQALAALRTGALEAVLHYSRRSATLALHLAQAGGAMAGFAQARHICLSEDVAKPLRELGLPVVISPAANTRSLFDALETG